MVRNQSFNKGITYVIIAILCLANLFLGAKVIGKLADIKKSSISDEENMNVEKVISVFNVESSNIKESSVSVSETEKVNDTHMEKTEIDKDIENNIFLKILLNSNAYMKIAYEMENKGLEMKSSQESFFSRLAVLLKPDFYIKPHLPAIVNAFNETYSWESKKTGADESPDLDGYIVLSDIIFVEDPEERKELDQELELMGKKHEDKLYIEPPKSVSLDHENPYILIYHTHGTEAYLPINTDRFHTEKREYNVLAVGETIAKVLEEKGHKLKWVDVYHDIPSYNDSYTNSLSTVKEELNKNKSIKVILDIHRDGIETTVPAALSKAEKAARVTIDGKSVATFSLVIGPNNPNKEHLIKFANYIRHTSESMYPGLFKGIIIKPTGKFNQYVSDYCALIEVGSNLNTIDEAKESAKCIGEILHKVLEDIEKQE
ncbi:stage II sporulation protein P [Proteiniborus sp. MB09-C3]|uniref:stage II sporulation protein P n=1 Tax=Proteiniborus sp. MB09-C3 TaxID=3050072 RepID=UPI0025539CA0|nr:stage II sporulation protein P [Proteiniborus sp. MB09-C3]WIV10676.1 stage II sporulation protein P [Proteiniborus sp. MB09-C3]